MMYPSNDIIVCNISKKFRASEESCMQTIQVPKGEELTKYPKASQQGHLESLSVSILIVLADELSQLVLVSILIVLADEIL